MNFQNFAWRRLALFFLLVLCYVLLMHTAREESNQLLLLYFSACGLSYFLIQHSSLQQILYQGILVRFIYRGSPMVIARFLSLCLGRTTPT